MEKREALNIALKLVWDDGIRRDKGTGGIAVVKDTAAILRVLDYNVRVGTPIQVGKNGDYIEYPIWMDNTQFFVVMSRPATKIQWEPYVSIIDFEWSNEALVLYHPEHVIDNE